MKIVVTTPYGTVGRHVVRHLVWAGLRPTLLAHDAARLPAEVHHTCEVVELDLLDVDAVVAASRGAEAMYWVDPPLDGGDPVADHDRLGAVAAQVVETNSVRRTVFQSSGGAEKRHGAGEIDGLALTEQRLDATVSDTTVSDTTAVTHLRCGFFFTNLLLDPGALESGRLATTWPVDHEMAWVAPRDIALVATLRLLRSDWSGRHVQGVHGPCDLTWRRVAEILTGVTGRQFTTEQVPDEVVREQLSAAGMGAHAVEAILGMSVGLRDGFVPEQARDVSTTTPTTLAAWAREELVPMLG